MSSTVEHIYRKPAMWVGSCRPVKRSTMLFDYDAEKVLEVDYETPPAVEHLIKELIDNTTDNVVRTREAKKDPGKIWVQMDESRFTIRNEGNPIPIQRHESGPYLPEVLFGHVFSSSNYGDEEKKARTGAGTNGVGVKAVNIFSQEFTVVICDSVRGLNYRQKWCGPMMREVTEPVITELKKNKTSFVQVSFVLDFAKFGMESYSLQDSQRFAMMLLNASAQFKIPVVFNGVEYDFSDVRNTYARLFFTEEQLATAVHIIQKGTGIFPSYEILAVDCPIDRNRGWTPRTLSSVNGCATVNGGVHVDEVFDVLGTHMTQAVNSSVKHGSKKKFKVTARDIKALLSTIIICHFPNPELDAQTKTKLSHPKIPLRVAHSVLESMMGWHMTEVLYATLSSQQKLAIAMTDGKKSKYVKVLGLRDANKAGGKESGSCTLLVMEGKSASEFASRDIDCRQNGYDYWGTFPLRGKLLNVWNATSEQIANNRELNNLKAALGLREVKLEGKKVVDEEIDYRLPKERATLRYGYMEILTDADEDGKHIAGLIILWLYCIAPTLLETDFLKIRRTPQYRLKNLSFYTTAEFDAYRRTHKVKADDVLYCKGLGTSKTEHIIQDAKDRKTTNIVCDEDAPHNIEMAFSSDEADLRKEWILSHVEDPSAGCPTPSIDISKFIFDEVVVFMIVNMKRALPREMDGLKISQRMIVWGAMKRKGWTAKVNTIVENPKEVKVAQLGPSVAEMTEYPHGENSLLEAIISMAHTFVGSNNMALFTEDGQFGTRDEGGKNHSSARYIFTRPQSFWNTLFRVEDLPLLEELRIDRDGHLCEPRFLLPVVPLHLINGARAVGSGWSSFFPNYNPLHIIQCLEEILTDKEHLIELIPWYRGFEGTITLKNKKSKQEEASIPEPDPESTDLANLPSSSGGFSMITEGRFDMVKGKVIISELPLGVWTSTFNEKFKDWVLGEAAATKEEYVDKAGRNRTRVTKKISAFENHSSADKVRFVLSDMLGEISVKSLGLRKAYGLTNMVVLNEDDRPIHHDDIYSAILSFVKHRLPFYEKRRQNQISSLQAQKEKFEIKRDFLLAIDQKKLIIDRARSKHQIYADAEQLGFSKELVDSVKLVNLSRDDIDELQKKIDNLRDQIEYLVTITDREIWLQDLQDFKADYLNWEKEEIKRQRMLERKRNEINKKTR